MSERSKNEAACDRKADGNAESASGQPVEFPKRPKGLYRHEETIKKSVFIALIGPADTAEDALAFIQQHSEPAATHNCWAYRIGQVYRFNDDGEPGGTAGKPMLAAIDGQGFDHTVALVIRHFGGIKLGTGGLMRAYGGVVSRGLQQAPWEPLIPQTEIRLHVPFEHAQILHQLASRHQARVLEENYSETGVDFRLRLPASSETSLLREATNLTRGQARTIPCGHSAEPEA